MRTFVQAKIGGLPLRGTQAEWLGIACAVICSIGMAQLVGCAPARGLIPLEIRQTGPVLKKMIPEAGRLKVAVAPFEDLRDDTSVVGFRRNWLGQKTPLTLERGDLGSLVAEVWVEDGRQRRGWEAWLAKTGVLEPKDGPDFLLKGKILTFEANASPGFGGTNLSASVRIELEITDRHAAGRAPLVVVTEGMESGWVFWFERNDLERLLNSTIKRAMATDQFMARAAVDGRTLPQK
jgi:hypothetical protein